MSLKIIDEIPGEIAHFYEPSSEGKIFSTANKFYGKCNGVSFDFKLPLKFSKNIQSSTRLGRRLTRTDKSSAVFNYRKDGIVILYLGNIYYYDIIKNTLTQTGTLRQSRNVLHRGLAVTSKGLFFGEYGSNPERKSVPLWRSTDDGRSWEIFYEFPAASIRHIHGVYADPYSDSLWVPTGDFEGECGVFEIPNHDASKIRRFGNGLQEWRPVSLLFAKDSISWGMDSPLRPSKLQTFDRETKQLTEGRVFAGPVWYSKALEDGLTLLQSSVEIGVGCLSNYAKIYASSDHEIWHEVGDFKKDLLPKRLFKFGVIAFADGKQTSDDFLIFGEALKGLDGKILRARITRG